MLNGSTTGELEMSWNKAEVVELKNILGVRNDKGENTGKSRYSDYLSLYTNSASS